MSLLQRHSNLPSSNDFTHCSVELSCCKDSHVSGIQLRVHFHKNLEFSWKKITTQGKRSFWYWFIHILRWYNFFVYIRTKELTDFKNSFGILFVNELAVVLPTFISFGPLNLILFSLKSYRFQDTFTKTCINHRILIILQQRLVIR